MISCSPFFQITESNLRNSLIHYKQRLFVIVFYDINVNTNYFNLPIDSFILAFPCIFYLKLFQWVQKNTFMRNQISYTAFKNHKTVICSISFRLRPRNCLLSDEACLNFGAFNVAYSTSSWFLKHRIGIIILLFTHLNSLLFQLFSSNQVFFQIFLFCYNLLYVQEVLLIYFYIYYINEIVYFLWISFTY